MLVMKMPNGEDNKVAAALLFVAIVCLKLYPKETIIMRTAIHFGPKRMFLLGMIWNILL